MRSVSYKVGLLAFPSDVADGALLDVIGDAVDTLRADLTIGDVWVRLAEVRGLKFAQVLAADRSPGSFAHRGTLVDTLYYAPFPSAFLGHDDQNGVYLYDGRRPGGKGSVTLVSDGPTLGGTLGRVTTAYPQRGLTHAEARARVDAATEAEIGDAYHNAVRIGLRDGFGWDHAPAYLDVCHAADAYPLDGDRSARAALPGDGLRALFPFYPEDDDFRAAKVQMRVY